MAGFPETDSDIVIPFAYALGRPDYLHDIHDQAEASNKFYTVAHNRLHVLSGRELIHKDTIVAFLLGVQAFEAIGSLVMNTQERARYTYEASIMLFNGVESSRILGDDFHQSIDQSLLDLAVFSPNFATGIRIISEANLADNSAELLRYAIGGAAVMRTLQMEMDTWQQFESEFEIK